MRTNQRSLTLPLHLALALLPACTTGDPAAETTHGESGGATGGPGTDETGTDDAPTTGGESTTGDEGSTGSAASTGDAEASTGGSDSSTGGPPPLQCEPTLPPGEAVPLNDACVVPERAITFQPTLEWSLANSGCYQPVVAQAVDTNGSGALDERDMPVVFLPYTPEVAFRGDGGGPAWEAWEFNQVAYARGFAVGDLDGDGWLELVAANKDQACVYDARDGVQRWCAGSLGPHIDDGDGLSFPALADMNGDGAVDVLVGNAILSDTGATVALGGLGRGTIYNWGDPQASHHGALSAAVDLDGDGALELVTGNAAYDAAGAVKWGNNQPDGFVAVADFDLDGAGEVVVTNGGLVTGLETDGSVAWGPIYLGTYATSAPAAEDLDGDGAPEAVFVASDTLFATRWGGETLWSVTVAVHASMSGPVIHDFESDGEMEILLLEDTSFSVRSGADGALKFSIPDVGSSALGNPLVADIDDDNRVEIVLSTCGNYLEEKRLLVYGDDSWRRGRKIWNQHTYHGSNVGELGQVPADYQSPWVAGGNNFRSTVAGPQPTNFSDLQAEIVGGCLDDCVQDRFLLSVRVRNAGSDNAPAGVAVSVRAGDAGPVIATGAVADPIPWGSTSSVVVFELPVAAFADAQPHVTVDDDGAGGGVVVECDEANNTAVWQAPVVCDESDG